MANGTRESRMPDCMEAVFDVSYLIFDLAAGVLFFAFSQGRSLFHLYGILTFTLFGGDAFHLIPRVVRAVKGSSEKIEKLLGIGLQIASITMTIFYVILLFIWKQMFYELEAPVVLEGLIWGSALLRIVLCLLPQNNWCGGEGSRKLSILRNAVFAVTGLSTAALYVISGNTYGYHMTRMAAAIVLSFGCYLPVTLLGRKMPKIGMLMIPKTCAYVWMLVMGLQLL